MRLRNLCIGMTIAMYSISCSIDESDSLNNQNKTEEAIHLRTNSISNTVHHSTYGYSGEAEDIRDCPTGITSCLTTGISEFMLTDQENYQSLLNENPELVIMKFTLLEDNKAEIEFEAQGSGYPHSETPGDILTVPEGGVIYPSNILEELGYDYIEIVAGEYQIEEKTAEYFWNGKVIVNVITN